MNPIYIVSKRQHYESGWNKPLFCDGDDNRQRSVPCFVDTQDQSSEEQGSKSEPVFADSKYLENQIFSLVLWLRFTCVTRKSELCRI